MTVRTTLTGQELGRLWRARQRSVFGLILVSLIPLTAWINETSLTRHQEQQRQSFEQLELHDATRVELPMPPLVGLDGTLYASVPTAAIVGPTGIAFAPPELSDNPAIQLLGRIDPLTLVTLLLSLLVVVTSFDMIAAEREAGTLQLLLARGVPRGRLLRAKVASRWLVATLLLAAGLGLAVALVSPAGATPGDVALRLAGLIVLGAMFLGAFVHLAALVSTALRRPVACLLTLLLLWILLVVVMPPVGALAAEAIHPVGHGSGWMAARQGGPGAPAPPAGGSDLRLQQRQQLELASLLTVLSPATPFIRGFRTLCGTGGEDLDRFPEAVIEYRHRLEAAASAGARPPALAAGSELRIPHRGGAEALAAALPDLVHLAVYDLVLFGFAQAYFRRRVIRLP